MDREKVIKELEERIKVAEECMGNPMFTPDAIRTIIAMLKEQEKKEIHVIKRNNDDLTQVGGETMYISPIEIQMKNLNELVMQTTEDGIVKAVWNMGFKVNAEELTQALTQDRKRYEYAYDQGWNDCKKHYEEKLKQISELTEDTD